MAWVELKDYKLLKGDKIKTHEGIEGYIISFCFSEDGETDYHSIKYWIKLVETEHTMLLKESQIKYRFKYLSALSLLMDA